jgi:hypothetical protein
MWICPRQQAQNNARAFFFLLPGAGIVDNVDYVGYRFLGCPQCPQLFWFELAAGAR